MCIAHPGMSATSPWVPHPHSHHCPSHCSFMHPSNCLHPHPNCLPPSQPICTPSACLSPPSKLLMPPYASSAHLCPHLTHLCPPSPFAFPPSLFVLPPCCSHPLKPHLHPSLPTHPCCLAHPVLNPHYCPFHCSFVLPLACLHSYLKFVTCVQICTHTRYWYGYGYSCSGLYPFVKCI